MVNFTEVQLKEGRTGTARRSEAGLLIVVLALN